MMTITTSVSVLREAWSSLSLKERLAAFEALPRADAEALLLGLNPHDQAELLVSLPAPERKLWFRALPPDDAADCLQAASPADRKALLELLDEGARREMNALLAYAEDDAGGLMSPRFARVRPDMRVDEALSYLRRQALERVETLYYAYVLDLDQRLLGVASIRELFAARSDVIVAEVMRADVIMVREDTDQEDLVRLFAEHDLLAIPVVDEARRLRGIVTVDDVVDVEREESTEDFQKVGGMQALAAPYLEARLSQMLKRRGGWLSILLVGEMFTASAMAHFEEDIRNAIVLALFVPLIISSGGNAGSQAATLVIRAMTIGELHLRDWRRVLHREMAAGLALGALLGAIGILRILLWQLFFGTYGPGYFNVAITVGVSLVAVVVWGAIMGAMLPFILRSVSADPATASTPLVATIVDVSGIVIYFGTARLFLHGGLPI
jgi:magnesium transporter